MIDINPGPGGGPPRTAGGLALILIGGLLLLFPGGCSLVFMVIALLEKMSSRPDQYGFVTLTLIVSSAGFLVAALGYWMLRLGLRRRASR